MQVDPLHLRLAVRYDPDSGKLHWLHRVTTWGIFDSRSSGWNKVFAGREAFCQVDRHGYRFGRITCLTPKKMLAHRVAWAVHFGEWPGGEIDHINGDRQDNRISNLRCVTRSENCRNIKRTNANTSGVVGVRWHKRDRRWLAQIKVEGVFMHLGSFKSKSDAIEARKAAERHHGFHVNHGRVVD